MLTLDQVTSKSEAKLAGLYPVVLEAAKELIARLYRRKILIRITEGLRTIAEQDRLYSQGRSRTELNKAGLTGMAAQPLLPKVTNARGGYSYHNYGLAVDFALLLPDGRQVSWDRTRDSDENGKADWNEVAQEGKRLGFEWGGDWSSFKDYPHLQMTFGLSLARLRAGERPDEQTVRAAYARIRGEEASVKKPTGADSRIDTNGDNDRAAGVTVKVNGVKVAAGILSAGVTTAPIRPIAEALGATIRYEAASQTVDIRHK